MELPPRGAYDGSLNKREPTIAITITRISSTAWSDRRWLVATNPTIILSEVAL